MVVLFSKREAMPMVFLEAMKFNKPFIVPRIGIFKEPFSCDGVYTYNLKNLSELLEGIKDAINSRKANSIIYSEEAIEKYVKIDFQRELVRIAYKLNGGAYAN